MFQAALALRQQRLTEEAEQARPLAEADRMRTALLTAVSDDLRSPLASAKAAVESLRAGDVSWTEEEHDELLVTADESLDRLVANLLDMSRLQAGARHIRPTGRPSRRSSRTPSTNSAPPASAFRSMTTCPMRWPTRRCSNGRWST
jgi:K+-sensing histidine kinase KdpD